MLGLLCRFSNLHLYSASHLLIDGNAYYVAIHCEDMQKFLVNTEASLSQQWRVSANN